MSLRMGKLRFKEWKFDLEIAQIHNGVEGAPTITCSHKTCDVGQWREQV